MNWYRLLGSLCVTALLLAGCTASSNIQTPPLPAPATPAETPIEKGFIPVAMSFSDQREGYISGLVRESDTKPAKGFIAKTADGGAHWSVVYRSNTPVASVATEGKNAWAVLTGSSQYIPDYVMTQDAGQTWAPIKQGAPAPSYPKNNAAQAVDAYLGHSLPAQPCDAEPRNKLISFASPANGYAVCNGQAGAGRMGKTFYATQDGGKTWSKTLDVPITAGVAGGIPSNGYPQGICFLADGHGWLWEARGNAYATADGGKTWRALDVTSPESKEATAIWFADDQDGCLLLQNNDRGTFDFLSTTDGGKTWKTLQSWPRT